MRTPTNWDSGNSGRSPKNGSIGDTHESGSDFALGMHFSIFHPKIVRNFVGVLKWADRNAFLDVAPGNGLQNDACPQLTGNLQIFVGVLILLILDG